MILGEVLGRNWPDDQWNWTNEGDYSTLEWFGPGPKPSMAQINAATVGFVSPYRLYKSTLIRRLTEGEAVTLTALLDASPVKSKMLWEASEWLGSDDPLFADLTVAIAGALGAERANEILGRE